MGKKTLYQVYKESKSLLTFSAWAENRRREGQVYEFAAWDKKHKKEGANGDKR